LTGNVVEGDRCRDWQQGMGESLFGLLEGAGVEAVRLFNIAEKYNVVGELKSEGVI
jgi:hypothetical protein